jgi:hypothetical protein
MKPSFEALVDQVRTCSIEEKSELKFLIERDLVNARRQEISGNHSLSQKEAAGGKLEFSASLDELKKLMARE